jgi:hypothetical protein
VSTPAAPDDALTAIVLPHLAAFCAGPHGVRTGFVTGSFVGGAWNRTRPNLNVYFVSGAQAGDAAALRWALRGVWRELRGLLEAAGIELVVDCHPYTVPQRRCATQETPVITVTSKVLDAAAPDGRYWLAPTIGPGWASRFRVLSGDARDVELLAPHPVRDAEWARTVHRALSYYRNMIDHLPWAVDRDGRTGDLVEESARYAEEAYKDALALALTPGELAAGGHIGLLAGGVPATAAFTAERFGADGTRALDLVLRLKTAAARAGATEADAHAAWQDANTVWEWAWSRYLPCAAELLPGERDFQRVDAFV